VFDFKQSDILYNYQVFYPEAELNRPLNWKMYQHL